MSIFNLTQQYNFAKSFIFKKSPLYVQFYITARCNLACEQCNVIYSDAKHHEMKSLFPKTIIRKWKCQKKLKI